MAPLCRVKGAEQRLSKLGLASLRAAAGEHCVTHCLAVLCHPTGQGQRGTDQGAVCRALTGEPGSTGAVTELSKMQEDRRGAGQTAGHADSPAHAHIKVSTRAGGGTAPSCHFVWALKGPGQQQQPQLCKTF